MRFSDWKQDDKKFFTFEFSISIDHKFFLCSSPLMSDRKISLLVEHVMSIIVVEVVVLVVAALAYLLRQQERDLMQKSRRLMDESTVSFQMFLVLLSFITFGSESQISVFKQCQSNT